MGKIIRFNGAIDEVYFYLLFGWYFDNKKVRFLYSFLSFQYFWNCSAVKKIRSNSAERNSERTKSNNNDVFERSKWLKELILLNHLYCFDLDQISLFDRETKTESKLNFEFEQSTNIYADFVLSRLVSAPMSQDYVHISEHLQLEWAIISSIFDGYFALCYAGSFNN